MNALQPNLFDDPPRESGRARRHDPDTAKKAAAKVPVADLEARVLRALRLSHYGMTTHELAWLLKVDLVSVSPRMRPLTEKGLVQDSGERRRPAGCSRTSIVWKATV
jgi:hypothetical protein